MKYRFLIAMLGCVTVLGLAGCSKPAEEDTSKGNSTKTNSANAAPSSTSKSNAEPMKREVPAAPPP